MLENTMNSDSRQRRWLVASLVWAMLVVLIVVSPALATGRSKSPVAISVVPSHERLAVHMRAAAGSRCVLQVTAKHKSMSFPAIYVTRRGKATIAWTVPANAPSGRWTFSVSCRVGHKTRSAKERFLLINHGTGEGSLAEPDSTRVLEGGLGGKGAGPCGALSAPDEHGHCVSFPGDPFNYYEGGSDIGQCTWYAAGRRPDLWGITRGNAKTWLREAVGRVPEGAVPVPGAIAVDEGGTWGHVAYVVGVSGPNVIVDDSNYWGDVTVHYSHPIPASHFAGYIYGGPAGSGPGSSGGGPGGGTPGGGGPGATEQTGDTQMFIRGDGAIFAKSSVGENGWTEEVGPGSASAIAASSTGVQMFIRRDSSIWAKNSIGNGGWTEEVGPGNATAIAAGGNTQMFIRGDSAIFAKATISENGWTEEVGPGNATAIAASSTGVQMFIRGDSAIFAKGTISENGWTEEVGPGNATAIAAGGNTQMFIRGDGAIFAKDTIGENGWTEEVGPGNATAIAAG